MKRGEKATCALFFSEDLQEQYLDFVRDVMTPVNPYTGVPLMEDPAVAILEVQNESNTLFWTLNEQQLAASTRDYMEKALAAFAAERHGSLREAFAHWGTRHARDDAEAGRAGLLPAWNLTSEGHGANPRRAADQIEFLARAQYDLYAKMKRDFRAMGVRQLVAASNWKTADPSTLAPLEHWSYTAADMVCKNEYFSPVSIENERFYAVDVGEVFGPLSTLKAPEIAGPLMNNQLAGIPYLVTENNWDNPNLYRAEWPFLVATYGALAGMDGWNFFSYDTPMWDTATNVWSTNTPSILGQYPAFALMFRRGDVREGPPAVVERKRLADLYGNQPLALPEVQYKDEVWKGTLGGDPKVEFRSRVDPRAFFAGPVRLELVEEGTGLETADLGRLIDEEARVITDTAGQLRWDWGRGVVAVDTPRAQGAAGFLRGAGQVKLADVAVSSENEYAVITVVSLDDRPLAESARVLIQAATQDKPHGFTTVPEGPHALKITALGGYPLNVERIRATVVLRGMAGRRVVALDALGYPTDREVRTQDSGANLIVTLPEDTLYTVVLE